MIGIRLWREGSKGGGRAPAERLGSEIGIEDPCRATVILSASEGSWYTPVVNHLLINTSRRGGGMTIYPGLH